MRDEMTTLIDKLEIARIPFAVQVDDFDCLHVMYPDNWKNGCKCSVICNKYSYGGKEGLLEIMGLLTEEEAEYDEVAGYLTADNVFARIYTDYINSAD